MWKKLTWSDESKSKRFWPKCGQKQGLIISLLRCLSDVTDETHVISVSCDFTETEKMGSVSGCANLLTCSGF